MFDNDIKTLLSSWKEKTLDCLKENTVGLYLTGSLTYGDFVLERSDIDLCAVVKNQLNQSELNAINQMHLDIKKLFPFWHKRIECSYVPFELLTSVAPPETPRPWWGFGVLYQDAPYGNEWIINNYFLWKCGVALYGPPFKELLPAVKMKDVQEACARDFYLEWLPKINDPQCLLDPHQQSYVVLNICRILCTLQTGQAQSKTESAAWTTRTYPQWSDLIDEASKWKYGKEMNQIEKTKLFITFANQTVESRHKSRIKL